MLRLKILVNNHLQPDKYESITIIVTNINLFIKKGCFCTLHTDLLPVFTLLSYKCKKLK